MRRTFASVTVLGFFGIAAYAAEVQGPASGVNHETRTILLNDGTSYVAAESIDLQTIATGAKVRITYDETTMQAKMIEVGM